MATAPDITFRSASSPYNALSAIAYVQSSPGGNNLPVLQGQNSNLINLRIYNNYADNAGIADALNVAVTTFDGPTLVSHTAFKALVSQSWIRIYEYGYGENSTPPGLFTSFLGTDTAIGGAPAGTNKYFPERSSNGQAQSAIRAGTDTNGVGFIEFQTYAQVPPAAPNSTTTFALSVSYEWTT